MAVKKQSKKEVSFSNFEVTMIPIEDLVVDDKNAKLHTPEQIEMIANSIRKFGFNDPIAVGPNNEIIEGHGRRLALLSLGAKQAPIIRLNSLNPAEVRAYRIAHNQATLLTSFDVDALMGELSGLSSEGFDLGFMNFDASMLPSMGDTVVESQPSYFEETTTTAAPKAKKGEEEPIAAGAGEEPKAPTPIIQYQIIFNDNAEQKKFHEFLKFLRRRVEGETVSERMLKYLEATLPAAEETFPELEA